MIGVQENRAPTRSVHELLDGLLDVARILSERNRFDDSSVVDKDIDMISLRRYSLEDQPDPFLGGDVSLDAKKDETPKKSTRSEGVAKRKTLERTHGMNLPFSPSRVFSTSSKVSILRPIPRMVAPFDARAMAMSRPSPLPAPVITTTLEATSKSDRIEY